VAPAAWAAQAVSVAQAESAASVAWAVRVVSAARRPGVSFRQVREVVTSAASVALVESAASAASAVWEE
jgi:hypothetical protein